MKSSLVTFILGCILSMASLNVYSQTSDLIISEYGEGSSYNKYIEIYNGTGADVDLTGYEIKFDFNGNNTWSTTIPLVGTILNGDVFILAKSTASSVITSQADQISTTSFFNGNDVVGLFATSILIDVVGIITVPNVPSNTHGWDVSGVNDATVNHTLVRKSTVCSPNTDWAASAGTSPADSEWFVNPEDDWTNLGAHSSACGGVPVPLNPILIIIMLAGSFFFIRRQIR